MQQDHMQQQQQVLQHVDVKQQQHSPYAAAAGGAGTSGTPPPLLASDSSAAAVAAVAAQAQIDREVSMHILSGPILCSACYVSIVEFRLRSLTAHSVLCMVTASQKQLCRDGAA
jgi:hypothetical protein